MNEYPNNLTAAEYNELAVASAIHPTLIEKNFRHIEGEEVYSYLFISPHLPRKNAGRVTDGILKAYLHLMAGGMWISGLDPLNNWEPMEWGRLKPTDPRIDWHNGKLVKYESPPKTPNRVTYFDVPDCIWGLVAKRYNIKRYDCPLAQRLQDRLTPLNFWEWVQRHPEIPIILCEGEKKAACLLSLGFAAIALPGIWNGRIGTRDFDERLHPDLLPMAQQGRKYIILFDYETKTKTRWSVHQAIIRTGQAIEAQDCTCEVALLPGPEKGVDDFVVALGEEANQLLTAIVNDAQSLKEYRRSFLIKHRGLRKYQPDVIVDTKYLTDAVSIEGEGRRKEDGGRRMNLVGDSEPYEISAGELKIQQGTQTLPLSGRHSEENHPSSLFPLPSSFTEPEPNQVEETLLFLQEPKEPVEEIPAGHKEKARYKLKKSQSKEPTRITFPRTGLIVLISDMGTGKTELMRWWREHHPNERFLNNGHRVNLLKNLAERLGTEMYSNLGYTSMAEAIALSITIDSLHKLNTQSLIYGCVFIDEACQYLTHLLHSKTCKEYRAAILEVLQYIVYNAPLVVIADAHMDDVTIEFFMAMRPKDEKPYIIKNEWKNGDRIIYWHEGDNYSSLVAEVSAATMDGQKAMVVSDSKRFVKKLEKLLSESNLKVWSIHSDNSGSEENVAFIKDIANAVKDVDVLITSPSLGTGVDIPKYHFDLVFGVFMGTSQTATECAQQLWRYRPNVPMHVWVAPRPPFGYKDTSPSKIKEHLLQTNEITAFLLRIAKETGRRGVEKDWALDAYCEIQAVRHQSLNNLRADLRDLLTQMGNRIIPLGNNNDTLALEQLKKAADALDTAHYHAVANANNISKTEYRARQVKDYLSPQEIVECEKFRIQDSYGMEVTPELVEKDNNGRLVSAIASFEAILSPSEEVIQDANGKQYPLPPSFIADKDRAERNKLPFCMDWGNYSAKWLARFNLGLHHILGRLVAGEEIKAYDPQLLNMLAIAKGCASHVKTILGFTVPPDCQPIWLVATLVKQLGLKLDCRKQGPRGMQIKLFSLSKEELSFALQVIAYRQQQRSEYLERQSGYNVESVSHPVSTPPHDGIVNTPFEGGVDTNDFLLNCVGKLRDGIAKGVDAIKGLLKKWGGDLRWQTVLQLEAIAEQELRVVESVFPEFYEWLSEDVLPVEG